MFKQKERIGMYFILKIIIEKDKWIKYKIRQKINNFKKEILKNWIRMGKGLRYLSAGVKKNID